METAWLYFEVSIMGILESGSRTLDIASVVYIFLSGFLIVSM